MKFQIVLGNHSNAAMIALGDRVRFVRAALHSAGHGTSLSVSDLDMKATALFFEDFSRRQDLETIQSFARAGGRFGIICAETVMPKGLNFHDNATWPDDFPQLVGEEDDRDADYWHRRFENLKQILPISQFVWCFDAASLDTVRDFAQHDRVAHFRLGYLPGYQTVQMLPLAERNYDFGFFGHLTTYRKARISELRAGGFSVYAAPYVLPTYLMNEISSRVRVHIQIPMDVGYPYANFFSLSDNLNNNIFQFAEQALPSHLDKFVFSAPRDIFLSSCANAVSDRTFFESSLERFVSFKNELPMNKTIETVIKLSALETD